MISINYDNIKFRIIIENTNVSIELVYIVTEIIKNFLKHHQILGLLYWFQKDVAFLLQKQKTCVATEEVHPAKKVFEHLRYFVSKNLY